MENDTEIVDYSEPLLKTHKHLKFAQSALLHREYDYALENLLHGIAEMRLAIAAIRHLKESQR
jgi:hypothetical protein